MLPSSRFNLFVRFARSFGLLGTCHSHTLLLSYLDAERASWTMPRRATLFQRIQEAIKAVEPKTGDIQGKISTS